VHLLPYKSLPHKTRHRLSRTRDLAGCCCIPPLAAAVHHVARTTSPRPGEPKSCGELNKCLSTQEYVARVVEPSEAFLIKQSPLCKPLGAAGMMCGSCVGRAKRLLEGQPAVTAASVNLATETALVRVLTGATANLSEKEALMKLGGQLAQVCLPQVSGTFDIPRLGVCSSAVAPNKLQHLPTCHPFVPVAPAC
jgi:copper chaperone CopZ